MSRQLSLNQLLPLKSTASHRIHVPVHGAILNCGGKRPISMVSKLISRELSGPKPIAQLLPTEIYSQYHHYRTVLCHHDVVHCALFDNSGKYFITGSYDTLVKIWSAIDGRLLITLRGIGSEITDIAIDDQNSMLATGSSDGMVRIWCLQTSAPIAFLNGHNGTAIKDVKFCPLVINYEKRVLVSSADNGTLCFWAYNPITLTFEAAPSYNLTVRNEKTPNAQVSSFSFSPGGVFMAVGSSDKYVQVFCLTELTGPVMIFESNKHTQDVFTEFSHHSTKFASGSNDGFVRIWNYQNRHWNMIQLSMLEKLSYVGRRTISMPSVIAIAWIFDDAYLITTSSDHVIRVWNPITGKLCHLMRTHTDLVWLIECHPKDPRLFITAGLDGKIFLWDIMTGKQICKFNEEVGVQILDCRFSPDGSMFVTTNAAGELNIFGTRKTKVYNRLPPSMFFHTDYRNVIRDEHQGIIIDAETQIQTHRMPALILVDHEGFSHPNLFQRLVPGREDNTDQVLELAIIPEIERVNQQNDEHRRNMNGQVQEQPVVVLDQNIIVPNDNQLPEWISKQIIPKLSEMMIIGHIKIQQTISSIELDEWKKMNKAKQNETAALTNHHPLNSKELRKNNNRNKIIRQTNESDLDDSNLTLPEEDDQNDNDFIVQSNRVSRTSSSRPTSYELSPPNSSFRSRNKRSINRKRIHVYFSSDDEEDSDVSDNFNILLSRNRTNKSKRIIRSSDEDEDDGDVSDNFNILLSRNRTNKSKRIIRSSDDDEDDGDVSDNFNILLSRNRTNKSKRIIRSSDEEEDDA